MKDPALLFYPKDFLLQASTLSMKERGQYITVLCYLHQLGSVSIQEMKILLGGKPSPLLLEKLQQDTDGKYVCQWLQDEVTRRQKYSKSQSEKAKKRWG